MCVEDSFFVVTQLVRKEQSMDVYC